MVSGSVGTLKAVTLNRIGLKYRTSRRGSTRESSMTRRLLFVVSAGLVFIALLAGRGPTAAQTSTALTGRVSSAEEGAMEGVVVSAKKAGSTVTVSVVSDDRGRFSFPSSLTTLPVTVEPAFFALTTTVTVSVVSDDRGRPR